MTSPEVIKPSVVSPRSSPHLPPRDGDRRSKALSPRTSPLPDFPRSQAPARTHLPVAGRRLQSRGAHGFAGLGRPRWDTRVGQRRPEPVALQPQPGLRSLGGRVTWAGSGRASQARVTLYLRLGPRAQATGTRGRRVIYA